VSPGDAARGAAPDALREMVREVLRDVLPALAAPLVAGPVPAGPPAAAPRSALETYVSTPGAPADVALPARPPTSVPGSVPVPAAPHGAGGGQAGAGAAFRLNEGWPGTEPVRLASDEDLHAFVLRVVALADNPKRRRDLLTGRLRFTLAAGGPAALGGNGAAVAAGDHRIEKGAVTERAVQAAAGAGARLVLGPRAVLTPLARDRARALGVPIEKER
jgi:hypothetical protein